MQNLRPAPAVGVIASYGSPWSMFGSPFTGGYWSTYWRWVSWSFGLGPGNVAFDAGGEVVSFGIHLTEAEATELASVVATALKQG